MKSVYKNDQVEMFVEDKERMFLCTHCRKMDNAIPVKAVFSNGQIKSFHRHCAETVVKELKNPRELYKERTIKDVVSLGGQPVKIINKAKDSKIQPVYQHISDPELDRKKAKLEAILSGTASSIYHEQLVAKEEEEAEKKPVAKIALKGDVIVLDHQYDQALIDQYHLIEQIKWNKEFKYWECNIRNADYETSRFLLKVYKSAPAHDWFISEDAYHAIKARVTYFEKKNKETKEIKELKKQFDVNIEYTHLKKDLFPYQKVGVAFLDKIGGVGMIGDVMGVGKTAQAIGYTSYRNFYTIVVCPASLKYNWRNEIQKFTNKSVVILTEFQADELNPKNKLGDYLIINYEQLAKYEKYLKKAKFDCVILDESQYIMNLQSIRTKTVFKLFKKIPHRLCLSGTPIRNRPVNFYAQLKFLRPDMFDNKQNFALRYCDAKKTDYGWDYNGASNMEELNRKISTFYIRRQKKDVLKELPDKTISAIEMELGATEKVEYGKISKEFDKFLNENWKSYGNEYAAKKLDGVHLSKLLQMKQFCSKAKVSRVVEFVKEFVDSSENRKILIFSQFVATQKALKEAFPGISVSLLGEDSAEERNQAVEQFQNDPKTRVFVGSMIAAGVGLTLTAADTVVFADLMWSPADHEQAADRVHRIGQHNPVFIYYFIFKDTIEELIWSVIGNKLEVISEVLDGHTNNVPDVANDVFHSLLTKFQEKRQPPPPTS